MAPNAGSESDALHPIYVGTAGWTIPAAAASEFVGNGTHLARYALRLNAVEINSSFYKPHRVSTYERWAASVPDGFRFAVKAPREITHHRKLVETTAALQRFLAEVSGLGSKLGPLLIQLPPSLAFDKNESGEFFESLRARFDGSAVCEPRHQSWFSPEAERVLVHYRISRVAADPAPVPEAAHPGGWDGLVYYRLHGSPRIYYSAYSEDVLKQLWRDLRSKMRSATAWCIFDNTALGAAIVDALSTQAEMQRLAIRDDPSII